MNYFLPIKLLKKSKKVRGGQHVRAQTSWDSAGLSRKWYSFLADNSIDPAILFLQHTLMRQSDRQMCKEMCEHYDKSQTKKKVK